MDPIDKINVCVPIKVDHLMYISKRNKIAGASESVMNNIMDILSQKFNKSITYDAYHGFGHNVNESTGQFDGCLGRLQSGSSDTMLYAVDYPVDVTNITQGYIVFTEKLGFLGTFPYPRKYNASDFIKCFSSFDKVIWLIILLSLMVIWFILRWQNRIHSLRKNKWGKIRRKGRKASGHKTYINQICQNSLAFSVICHFLGIGSIEQHTIAHRLIFFTLSTFSFVIFAYFESFMNMDIVVITEPLIFKSYSDLIHHKVRPILIADFSDYQHLAHADEKTPGKEFWNWATKEFGPDAIFVQPNSSVLCRGIRDVINYKAVFFTLKSMLMSARSNFCSFVNRDLKSTINAFNIRMAGKNYTCRLSLVDPELHQTYLSFDESASDVTKGFVWGKRLIENEKYAKLIHTLTRNLIEYGFLIKLRGSIQHFRLIESMFIFQHMAGPIVQSKAHLRHQCIDNRVVLPDATISSVNFKQLFTSFMVLMVSLTLTPLVAIAEVIRGHKLKRLSRKKAKMY